MKNAALIVLACGALVLFAGCSGGEEPAGEDQAAGDDKSHDQPPGVDQTHDADGGEGDTAGSDPGHDHGPGADHTHGPRALAAIEAKNDSGVSGSAEFTISSDQVVLTLSVSGATPGEHAFHLHEIGDCSAPDGTSAGGHWNPTGMDHGKWGSDPFHLGDVANLQVGDDGTGTLTVATNLWGVGTGEANDVVGRSVIVHAGVDDFKTQPTGAAGGRIGCGVIQLVE